MAKSVEVTLAIKVLVDDKYSVVDHADDIILNTRKLFPVADVKVVRIRFTDENDRVLNA